MMLGATGSRKAFMVGLMLLIVASPLLGACAKEVVREVPVEKVIEKEVVREVPVEKVVEREVVKEVPVEKVVIQEVPVYPKPEGELVFSMTFSAFTPDPMLTTNTSKPFMELIFDPLVGKTNNAGLSADTGIATKWEVSADGLAHTFYLREGVKFHNGDDLTAEDVKFSLERVAGPKSVSGYASSLRKYIDGVDVVDPHKVTVRTKVPAPDLEFLLSSVMGTEGFVLPKKYIEDNGDDYFVKHPVGSGPYRVLEVVIGSHMKLEAVDRHWRIGIPQYKTIMLRHVTEEATRIAQLKRGEADVIEVSRDRAAEVRDAGFSVFTKPNSVGFLLLLTEMWDEDSPLADVRVREALDLGVNKREIADMLYRGGATPAGIGGLIPPDPAWDEGLFPVRPYDPERARRLIAEVGHPVRIKFYSYPRAGVPEVAATVDAIAGYWEQIGVKTEIVPMDYASFRKIWGEGVKGNKPSLGGGGVGAVGVMTRPARLWNVPVDVTTYHSSGAQTCLKSPEGDKLLDEAMAATTWKKMVELGREWHKFRYDNFITPGIVNLGLLFAANEKVKDWRFDPDESALGWDYLVRRR